MPRMFGTDGVRGLANRDLTAQLALDLGDAAVRVLGDDERSEFESRRRALVGRDTRVSGDFLAAFHCRFLVDFPSMSVTSSRWMTLAAPRDFRYSASSVRPVLATTS